MKLVLYTNPMSRGRIARWMLEEVGMPYETILLDYGTTMKAPEYLAVNPMGKVPAIVHGTTVVTEAAAICAYLGDAFPAVGLAPALSDPKRAEYYRWLLFAAGPLEQAVTNKALGFVHPKEKDALFGYGNYASVINTLEQKFKTSDYVTGDTFSAADVYVGSSIGWGLQWGTVEKRDALVAYWDRLKARPTHARATAIDDALMPKRA